MGAQEDHGARRGPQRRGLGMTASRASAPRDDEMLNALEQERRARKLETVPEAVRAVLGEYFKQKG